MVDLKPYVSLEEVDTSGLRKKYAFQRILRRKCSVFSIRRCKKSFCDGRGIFFVEYPMLSFSIVDYRRVLDNYYHVTADKKPHALLTETAFNHQLSTKQPSNVTTITLLKHTSDSQKTPSKLGTETTLHHSVTQNTGTLRNSVNMSGP